MKGKKTEDTLKEVEKASEEKESKDTSLEKLVYGTFEEAYIDGMLHLLYELLIKFYIEKNLEGIAYLNYNLVDQCFNDFISDLARLCKYHDIDEANDLKIYAYMASWVVKRQPFQLIESEENQNKDLFINERFAFGLILKETGIMGKTTKDHEKDVEGLYESIYYHIQYRNTNPKALLLLIDGIELGQMCALAKQ